MGLQKKISTFKARDADELEPVLTYPITRSNCSCLMLVDILQLTCPVVRVMANAWAMSSRIDRGISVLLLAAPTHMSLEPLCSNSLCPSCVSSAPQTRDRTTLVGKRSSTAASIPRLCVVLRRMQVCCGVTTASMTEARS